MSTVDGPEVDTSTTRRAMVQAVATRTLRRRLWSSRLFVALIVAATLVAAVPLYGILWAVIQRGGHFITWNFLTTAQLEPTVAQPHAIGGISNAITGSVAIDSIAAAIAIPFALILAMTLFEIKNRLTGVLRLALEVMIGQPSILLGIFVYSVFVVPVSRGAGTIWAGAFAIAFLMTPFIAIAAEAALRDVPADLIEAGLALGGRPSRIMGRVVLPFALPRITTGILLALSRAVGETAPILFIIGVSLTTNWNPAGPATSMPVMIFNYFGSSSPTLKQAAWGIALVLIFAVLVINLTSRFIVAMTIKGRK